jgi:rod shape determining protein RodA
LVLALLVASSLVFIRSASYDADSGTYEPYANRQAVWILIGLAAFFAVMPVKPSTLRDFAPVLFALAIALLVAVFAVGEVVKGARRWISLGPMKLQPSELAKIAAILLLARYLAARDMSENWRRLVIPLLIIFLPMALILKQPDLGTALVFVPVLLAMLWVSGVKAKHMLALVVIGLALVPAAWVYGLKDYQKARLVVFLDPENPNRVMKKFVPSDRVADMKKVDSYHLIQSQIAVGHGGLTGKGYGRGTQNTLGYLPEKHTDFIFGVVAEEWGFIGASLLMLLFFALIYIIFSIAAKTGDAFSKFTAVGVGAMFFTHVAVNTGMTVGLAPITGVTLPFLSYGGSSALTFFIALGLAAGAYRHRRDSAGI